MNQAKVLNHLRLKPGRRSHKSVGIHKGDGRTTAPPDLAELLKDPTRANDLPPQEIPAVLCQLAALQSVLAARLLTTPSGSHPNESPDGDTLVDVNEAAKRLGTSTDYLYRHSKRLPFTVRLAPRQLRFSARGIERYIRQRQGR